MNQELLNHKTKCRLCFQRVNFIRNCSRISKKIQQKFLSLTNIELKLSDSFSNSICKPCIKSLNESSEFQQKMIDNQQRLYAFEGADKFVVKIEPIELGAIELQEFDIVDFLPKTEVFDGSCMEDRKPDPFFLEEVSQPPSPATDDWIDSSESDDEQNQQASDDEFASSQVEKKDRADYPPEQLFNAVETVALGELTPEAASKSFGIPRATIQKNLLEDYHLLTDEEELQVKLYVNKRTEFEVETTDDDIKRFILSRLLSKRRGKNRVEIKSLSNTWVSMFRKRHSDMNVLENFTECEFSCDVCGFSVKEKRKLRKHMSLHVVEVHYPEQYSKITVRSNPDALEKALQAVAGGMSARESAKLHNVSCNTIYRHQKIRSRPEDEPEIFKCSFCDKAFFARDTRRSHEFNHHLTPVGEFPCKECGKVFPTRVSLKTHVRCVHLIGTFRCTQCSEVFSRHKDHKRHKREHQVDVACEICGKLVRNGKDYNSHLRTHRASFLCTVEGCSKEFRRKSSLQYHIESVHTPSQDLDCPKCSSTFPNATRLKIHDARVHSEAKFFCEVDGCSYKSTRMEYMKEHLRNHRNIDVKHRDELIAKLKTKRGR